MSFPAPGGTCSTTLVITQPKPGLLDRVNGWKFLAVSFLAFCLVFFLMVCACSAVTFGSQYLLHHLLAAH